MLRLAKTFGEPTDDGPRIGVKLSQQDLGNLMGTTRESVNKQMRSWMRDGLISVEAGYITIRDAESLEVYAEPD